MVNKNNTRMQVTMTKKLAEWIKTKSAELGMQPSAFINWLIRKNIAMIITRERPTDHKIIKELSKDQVDDNEWNKLFTNDENQETEEEDELPFYTGTK